MSFVNVKSAWLMKTNWVAVLTALLSLGIALGLPITEAQKVEILSFVGTVGPVIIVILRSFFTSSVTPAVAAKL
ncbi:MAG: hypothetical protein JWQ44_2927 [Chthoniobacter sp.]|nr:hypothetical protein [Chthoniobacter sp.]